MNSTALYRALISVSVDVTELKVMVRIILAIVVANFLLMLKLAFSG